MKTHTRISQLLVLALLLTGGLLTGCDTVDALEERSPDTRLSDDVYALDNKPEASPADFVEADKRPGNIVPNTDLLGAWQYVDEDGPQNKTVAFDENGNVRVEVDCAAYEGGFFSASPGHVDIYDLHFTEGCAPFAPEPLIGALEAVTSYKLSEGRLYLTIGEQALVFNAMGQENSSQESN